jgi:hypothetical protein
MKHSKSVFHSNPGVLIFLLMQTLDSFITTHKHSSLCEIRDKFKIMDSSKQLRYDCDKCLYYVMNAARFKRNMHMH